jgi:pimeloyl-ACP methyl ester carboxylesterase
VTVPARHFVRTTEVHKSSERDRHIREYIVPFPSAPIYGINRKREYGYALGHRPNLHTLRILRRPDAQPVERLFILHNGLNEADSLRFYYRLADWIFSEYAAIGRPGSAACAIVPFAGHLMHAPFHGPFSQTPLSRYLGDSGELFRQFLRYMVQMRWLFSALIDKPPDLLVGGDLVVRRRAETLPRALEREWSALARASDDLLERLNDEQEARERRAGRAPTQESPADDEDEAVDTVVREADMRNTVAILRHALNRGDGAGRLKAHVVGYSLGGFLAQSVFFAWPQLVASCTTICSGGAISAISPTAFAHAEEWQAVLHSLRAELEDAMLHGRLSRDADEKLVAGMRAPQFGYFKRVFDQVFLQEDQGSYRQRLSEYGSRMLFMSGGEDSIVEPRNVLDAGPREGINMLSIANLTHFLGLDVREDRPEEVAQREFWLPEVGRLIARAAMRAGELVDEEVRAARVRAADEDDERNKQRGRPRSADLSSREFDEALDWVLDVVDADDGWLIVSRNTLPAALLDEQHFSSWGKALHHQDGRVRRYADALRRRADALEHRRERFTLLVPEKLRHWFVDASALFDPQSDTPHGRFLEWQARNELWDNFVERWASCMRELDPREIDAPIACSGLDGRRLARVVSTWQAVAPRHLKVVHLPDAWIAFSKHKDAPDFAHARSREEFERHFLDWVADLVEELEPRTAHFSDPKLSIRGEKLQEQLQRGYVRIVQISDAEFNPRYRGRLELSRGPATRVLAQCAAGMLRSVPLSAKTEQPVAVAG